MQSVLGRFASRWSSLEVGIDHLRGYIMAAVSRLDITLLEGDHAIQFAAAVAPWRWSFSLCRARHVFASFW